MRSEVLSGLPDYIPLPSGLNKYVQRCWMLERKVIPSLDLLQMRWLFEFTRCHKLLHLIVTALLFSVSVEMQIQVQKYKGFSIYLKVT